MRLAHDVEEGNLADRRRHARIGRGRGKRIATPHPGAERRAPARIAAGQGAGKSDRGGPILELPPRIEEIRLPAAVTEPAVVEDERRESLRREALRKAAQAIATRPGETVGHNDGRRLNPLALSPVKPRRARIGAGAKLDVLSVHAYLTVVSCAM